MTVNHEDLTEEDVHEPYGVSTANLNEVFFADGSGSGSWKPVAPCTVGTISTFQHYSYNMGSNGRTFTWVAPTWCKIVKFGFWFPSVVATGGALQSIYKRIYIGSTLTNKEIMRVTLPTNTTANTYYGTAVYQDENYAYLKEGQHVYWTLGSDLTWLDDCSVAFSVMWLNEELADTYASYIPADDESGSGIGSWEGFVDL